MPLSLADKTIGILGGLGPAAGANFLSLLVRSLNERGIQSDSDFPHIILHSIPLADWGVEGATDSRSVFKQLSEALDWLQSIGSDVIAIPCNSVHEFYSEFSADTPIISIIRATLDKAGRNPLGVLCSQQSKRACLYESSGNQIIYPDQSDVDEAIDSVCKGSPVNIEKILSSLRFRGAYRLILGCTELSLCPRNPADDIIDSAECLADAVAEWVML